MFRFKRASWVALAAAAIVAALFGCATGPYRAVVRPTPGLSKLSPELERLTDDRIDTYLRADVRATFPTVLAVAKLSPASAGYFARDGRRIAAVEVLRGEEAEGWRQLASPAKGQTASPITQVQLVCPLLVEEDASLKSLRGAAALLHAPLLLVYVQDDNARQGYNDAAMAYWTFIGLFCVPGHTVGHYAACQAVLVDTRSGFILATAEGESKHEENVLPGAVDIAADRVCRQSQAEAIADLQEHVRKVIEDLARPRDLPTPGGNGR